MQTYLLYYYFNRAYFYNQNPIKIQQQTTKVISPIKHSPMPQIINYLSKKSSHIKTRKFTIKQTHTNKNDQTNTTQLTITNFINHPKHLSLRITAKHFYQNNILYIFKTLTQLSSLTSRIRKP